MKKTILALLVCLSFMGCGTGKEYSDAEETKTQERQMYYFLTKYPQISRDYNCNKNQIVLTSQECDVIADEYDCIGFFRKFGGIIAQDSHGTDYYCVDANIFIDATKSKLLKQLEEK